MSDIFPISFFVCLGFIFLQKYLNKKEDNIAKNEPQNLHKKLISRFGGVAIFVSLFLVSFLEDNDAYNFLRSALICAAPVFILGLIDDLRIVINPVIRLLTVTPSALMAYQFLGTEAYGLDIVFLDYLFEIKFFSILFICFALAGIVNAFNMIDGINGLVLIFVMTICSITVLFSQPYFVEQTNLLFVAIFFSCLGVLVLNFPLGRIFLGDGGSYFLGMVISIALIKHYQDNQLSPWYVACVLVYPITDTIFTILRRIQSKMSTMQADNQHLHHLIFTTVSLRFEKYDRLKHAITTLLIFCFYTPFMVLANKEPTNSTLLAVFCAAFASLYVVIYFILKNLVLVRRK